MLIGLLKKSVKTVISSPWGWRMSAPFRSRAVMSLMYHRINDQSAQFPGISVERFREQMQWVRNNCTPIRCEEIVDAARFAGKIRPPVVITFDDGYRDYHDVAYPILREYKIPAAVFLATSFMDNGGLIWTEAMSHALTITNKKSITLTFMGNRTYSLANALQRSQFLDEAKLVLKSISDIDRQKSLAELLVALGVLDPGQDLPRQMLSWGEVRATMDGTSYGGHTHTHPILSQLSAAAMEQEIRLCRDRLLAETNITPTLFAYPNGRRQDFNDATKAALKRSGFNLSFSTIEGLIDAGSDPMELRRQPACDTSLGNFAAIVAGVNHSSKVSSQKHGY